MVKLTHRVVVLLVLALAASCSGGSTSPVESTNNATNEVPMTEVPAGSSADAAESPETLEGYLGVAAGVVRGGGGRGGGGLAGADSDQITEQQRLIEREVQACMLEQGFTYVPEEVGDGLQFFLASEDQGISAAEYAETQGFGISTRFDAIFEGDVDFADTTDPNDEYLATLSEGEVDAWQFALRGAPPTRNDQGQLIDPETGEVLQGQGRGRSQATGGCRFEAQESVRGDSAALAELEERFDEVEERIDADARITEIRRNWASCMTEQGFDYQDEAEARADINTQFRPLLGSFFQSANAGADGQAQGGLGQGRGNSLEVMSGLELTPEQEQELSALQDIEREIAVAALACDAGTAEEVEQIRLRYESEFVAENRAALEALSG